MARAFELEFEGRAAEAIGVQPGFFAWVDGAPAEGYRAPRGEPGLVVGEDIPSPAPLAMTVTTPVVLRPRERVPIAILTGSYGVEVLKPLIEGLRRDDVRLVEVPSGFFGGNVGVAGLMVGEDLQQVLVDQPEGHRYLLPDVCLSGGRFLDGLGPEDLPRAVEIVATDGVALRRALGPAPMVPVGTEH